MNDYTWTGRVPASAVVHAIAAEEECDPEELDPLSAAIDPDVLNALFDPPGRSSTPHRRLEFRYAGYDVTVTGDGRIDVVIPDD